MSGKVVHFEIPANDVERARRFYEGAFGWQATPVPEMAYTMVSTTPSDQNGMPKDPGAINGGLLARRAPVTSTVITIDVDDLDAALAKLEQLGGKTVSARQAVGDMGFIAYFEDPESNVVGLWQSARRH